MWGKIAQQKRKKQFENGNLIRVHNILHYTVTGSTKPDDSGMMSSSVSIIKNWSFDLKSFKIDKIMKHFYLGVSS